MFGKRRLSILLWKLLMIFGTLQLFAQEMILYPVEDTYTRGGNYGDDQYGSDPELLVKQGNVSEYFRRTYLKFDVTGVDGTLVDSAILRLFAKELSGAMEVDLFECSGAWEESTLTWNNAPEQGKLIRSFRAVTAGVWYEMNITSTFLQQVLHDASLSLVLYDQNAFNQLIRFNSREAPENKPALMIYSGSGMIPSPPTGLVAVAVDTGSIQLHWRDESEHELGFIIEQKQGDGSFQVRDTTGYNEIHYICKGLRSGTAYTFRIAALGFSGRSAYTAEVTTSTIPVPEGPPLPPSGMVAYPVSTGKIDLEWSDLNTEEHFLVIERKEGDDPYQILDTLVAGTHMYSDFDVRPVTLYHYRIYASNGYFDSEPSPEVSATTPGGGTTYFLNAVTGDDTYPGTSSDSAWRSLDRVNQHRFFPGDSLRLACGSQWTGQLWPKGSGTETLPIRVGAYGNGNTPVIDGGGMEGSGVVYLYNQSFWEIEDLEITNDSPSEGVRRGVEIAGEDAGTIHHIYLRNLHVHHIRGTVGDDYEVAKRTGGIFFMVSKNDSIPTRFDDVKVEGCLIHDCSNQGIVTFNEMMGYPGSEIWMPRRITGMEIRNNTLHHISKNAMILRMMDGGLVEHNLCYTTATGTTGNTIFTRSSRNVVCQYNEGYDNQSPDYDGSLYDADLESPGCIFQYSYSHDNAHGLYWQCTVQQDTGVIVRYNISQNDRGRIFYINYPSDGTHIYNNTVFVREDLSPVILMESGSQGGTRSYTFRNNLIVNMSPTATYRSADNKFIRSRIIEHNLFYGIHPTSEPADPFKVTADPKLSDPGHAGTGLASTAGYQILQGSAAIDQGGIIPNNGGFDYWGNPLYTRGADIGAHEYTGPVAAGGYDDSPDQGQGITILPNPMTDHVAISFHLNTPSPVYLEILDSLGRRVFSQDSRTYPPGTHRVYWEGNSPGNPSLENGLYICNITINGPAAQQTFSRGIVIQR